MANLDLEENDSVNHPLPFLFYPFSLTVFCLFKTLNVALDHCDLDDATETASAPTGAVQKTVAGSWQAEEEVGVGTKVSFS